MVNIKTRVFTVLVSLIIMFGACAIPTSAAGVEDLPQGWYDIGAFTFTDTNLTPVKTVLGDQVRFQISWRIADEDQGCGHERLTVQVRDADTGAPLSPYYVSDMGYDDCWYWTLDIPTISVATGQEIQVWFDVSTKNPAEANGNFRTAHVVSFKSYVSWS